MPESDLGKTAEYREGHISKLHPLIHQNTSDFKEQKFTSIFDGSEFFLADHVVGGLRLLPGVAYLEMVQEAIRLSSGINGEKAVGLKNIIWIRPVTAETGQTDVCTAIYPEENGEIDWEIYSHGEDEPIIHCQGRAFIVEKGEDLPVIDIESLKPDEPVILSSDECYELLNGIGLEYGPGHRGIDTLYAGQDKVLSRLSLPSSVSETLGRFTLHPSLLDSALQSVMGLGVGQDESGNKPYVPFALSELIVFDTCTASMWASVCYSQGSGKEDKIRKVDIDLCDDEGKVCVRMKGFSSRVLENSIPETESQLLLLKPSWKDSDAPADAIAPKYGDHLVFLCEQENRNNVEVAKVIPLSSEENEIDARYMDYAERLFEEIKVIVADKPEGKVLVQVVVPLESVFAGFSGLLKTASLESSKLVCQVIEIDNTIDIQETLFECAKNPWEQQIRYRNSKRLVPGWDEDEIRKENSVPFKDGSVYLNPG